MIEKAIISKCNYLVVPFQCVSVDSNHNYDIRKFYAECMVNLGKVQTLSILLLHRLHIESGRKVTEG